MEKEFLKETLQHLLKELTSGETEKYEWYRKLFPPVFEETINKHYNDKNHAARRFSPENILATEAIKYPELHSLMEQVVIAITEIGEEGSFTQLWENPEEQAGGCLARELACYDKKYLPLYLRYLMTNDLDHEVHQMGDMLAIFHKWDYSKETFPIMLYRSEWGQNADQYENIADGICKTEEEAPGYLEEAVGYFNQEWSFDEVEEGDEDDNEDIENIVRFFCPVFKNLFKLDDEQMVKFALAFNNIMAADETPTIEQLLKAAK